MKARQRKELLKGIVGLGAVAAGLTLLTSGCQSTRPLATVDQVDLERYTGKWYEIASIPNRFQKNCTCTTAAYTINDDGTIAVNNRCYNTRKRKWEKIKGKAFVRDERTNAQLAVQFFWPFQGDYYIIALADDYAHALVGSPTRDYLWILSRTPQLPERTISDLKKVATEKGFDVSRLRNTRQQNCPPPS